MISFKYLAALAALMFTSHAAAEPFASSDTFKVIYRFDGSLDSQPGNLTVGPNGAVYGAGASTVFVLSEDKAGHWSEQTVSKAVSWLVGTPAALYGVSGQTIVKIDPPAQGKKTWTRKVIYKFSGSGPGGIVLAGNGDIYGVTAGGGSAGVGTVYRLFKDAKAWKTQIVHAFLGGSDGELPLEPPALDKAGDVFAATPFGGAAPGVSWARKDRACAEAGFVGEYISSKGAGQKITFKPEMLFQQNCQTGSPQITAAVPAPLLNFASDQALFPWQPGARAAKSRADGVIFTGEGGGNTADCPKLQADGCGVVAELTKPENGSTPWTLRTIHAFSSKDGAAPIGSLTFVGNTSLYGVASFGGHINGTCQYGCGVIYKLVRSTGDWSWGAAVHKFKVAEGYKPLAPLLYYQGKLFGTTLSGGKIGGKCGTQGCGTIFTVTP
ncbi:MAG: hypothetical protein WBQ17_15455 [Rhizomicrobium sp.]